MARLLPLTDPHLSPSHGFSVENFRQTLDMANRIASDLVVTTGALSIKGSENVEDLRFATHCHQALRADWKVLPGNPR